MPWPKKKPQKTERMELIENARNLVNAAYNTLEFYYKHYGEELECRHLQADWSVWRHPLSNYHAGKEVRIKQEKK